MEEGGVVEPRDEDEEEDAVQHEAGQRDEVLELEVLEEGYARLRREGGGGSRARVSGRGGASVRGQGEGEGPDEGLRVGCGGGCGGG